MNMKGAPTPAPKRATVEARRWEHPAMKRKFATTAMIWLVFIVGLGVLAYPTVANYWNTLHSTRAIANYTEQAAAMNDDQINAQLDAAHAYNQALVGNPNRFTLTSQEATTYNSSLDIDGTGMMGVLTIPKVRVNLPIYHGTSAAVLQVGVGHLAGSSLPVGGDSTHAVISGHRGLPSAELLTNIDKLVVGDQFQITILNQVLTYQVDKISTVDPDDLSLLAIVRGQDLVTLVTCTPYGVNTQRLLVRGHRVPTTGLLPVEGGQVLATSLPTIVVGALTAGAVVIYLTVRNVKRKKRSRQLCDAG